MLSDKFLPTHSFPKREAFCKAAADNIPEAGKKVNDEDLFLSPDCRQTACWQKCGKISKQQKSKIWILLFVKS